MAGSNNRPVLLMTASVDPRGCTGAMFAPEEREQQYLNALRFYIGKMQNHPELFSGLIFAENSGRSLSKFWALVPKSLSSKIELLSIATGDFIQERGKSYNEMLLINKVLDISRLLNTDDPLFLKVTGRYGILNTVAMLRDLTVRRDFIHACYSVWPRIRTRRNHNQHQMVDTRRIAFRVSVWNSIFREQYKNAGNHTGQHFETIAFDIIKQFRSIPGWIDGFRYPPLILAKEGYSKKVGTFTIPKVIEPAVNIGYFAYHCLAKRFSNEWDISTELSRKEGFLP
jgi:hypothetical protein